MDFRFSFLTEEEEVASSSTVGSRRRRSTQFPVSQGALQYRTVVDFFAPRKEMAGDRFERASVVVVRQRKVAIITISTASRYCYHLMTTVCAQYDFPPHRT